MSRKIIMKHAIECLDYTADDWELYADKPGANEVAEDINQAIVETFNLGRPRTEVAARALETMRKHEDYGATDSEPLYHLEKILGDLFQKW